jgi:hypothetical protein
LIIKNLCNEKNITSSTYLNSVTVINNNDIGDSDNSFNNISTDVLGGQFDDSPVTILF